MMTKFLLDENVNQKVVKAIPAQEKGFDILYPEQGTYKGARDPSVRKLAKNQNRVLVTCDKDFKQYQVTPDQVPNGVLLIRPPKVSQKQVKELLERFCRFLQQTFPEDPYNFDGKIIEVDENRIDIQGAQEDASYPLPPGPTSNHP